MIEGFSATIANFQVNTGLYGEGPTPVITALSTGGFVVTWMDPSTQTGDMSGTGISAQLFDASGAKVGAEFRVNAHTTGNQLSPAVTALSGGGFVVTWRNGNDISARVFDDAGNAISSELTANTIKAFLQEAPAITSLNDGGFVITWTDHSGAHGDPSGTGIGGQRFDALGNKVGESFLAAGYTALDQSEPAVTGLGDGGFVVTWTDLGHSKVGAQRFDATGAQVGFAFTVDSNGEGNWRGPEVAPTITTLSNGNFVVAWADDFKQGYEWPKDEVRAQIFNASGQAIYSQIRVNSTDSGAQNSPSITALDDGGFVVVWQSRDVNDNSHIVVQRFNEGGGKVGAETFLDYGGESDRILPQVTTTADGGFAISWQEHVRTEAGENIGIVVKATVFAPMGPTQGDDSLNGTAGNDSIDGLGGNDTIDGLAGDDTLVGGANNDSLIGGEGNDSLTGGDGVDTLIGGEGNDTLEGSGGLLDGGIGHDSIVALWSLSSTILGGDGNDTITDDGGAALVDGGSGNDSVSSYSSQIYGGSGNDAITSWGNNDPATISGGDGNDFIHIVGAPGNVMRIEGGAGDDTIIAAENAQGTIIGGDGRDLIQLRPLQDFEILGFTAGAGGDRIALELPGFGGLFPERAILEQQGNDVLVRWDYDTEHWDTIAVLKNVDINALTAENFEGATPVARVQASDNNDTLNGTAILDRIFGLGGNDVIRGYAGNDTLDGGAGNDSLYGGLGNDTYYIDNAADKVIELSSQGTDTVYASATWKAPDHVETVILTGTANIAAYGSAQANMLTGNSGNNTLNGADGNDTISGGDGNDKIDGGADHDVISGGAGKDSMTGGDGSDSIDGGIGDDQMNGGSRWDTLIGGEGNDILDGGADNDAMYGGVGDDTYSVDHIGDRVYENDGEGNDNVKASIDYSLAAYVESLYQTGLANIAGTGNGLSNAMNGNSGNNTLSGGLGNDSLYGWEGNDSLVGGNDHDKLSGGNGNDTLVGGHGQDGLGGGTGADDFVFSSIAINGHDHIVDFEHGVDRLVFKGSDYGFAAGHVLTAGEFTVGALAVGSTAQFIWDTVADRLYFDADGDGAGEAFELALISHGATVTKEDLFFTS